MEAKFMSEEAREAQRLYMKQWRANNKERTDEYRRRYWEKKAKEMNGNESSLGVDR